MHRWKIEELEIKRHLLVQGRFPNIQKLILLLLNINILIIFQKMQKRAGDWFVANQATFSSAKILFP